ncbi:hypothetical protein ACFXDH_47230, partial [Streptomyces sp. NPDC059467]|uniref:hypothetical protein n=1 Tax=Streptomyces sp. NPDC059467 TaxID=3346844 RepID=UPI0036C74209
DVSDSIRSFSDPISSVLSRFPLSRFPFRRFRLYQKFLAGLTGHSFLSKSGVASMYRREVSVMKQIDSNDRP